MPEATTLNLSSLQVEAITLDLRIEHQNIISYVLELRL
jgi:hypothetical protein